MKTLIVALLAFFAAKLPTTPFKLCAIEVSVSASPAVSARKAASIMHPDRLGPWLYGVAYRVAVRARANAAKRRCG